MARKRSATWWRRRVKGDVTPDMNVTPLVDVVLVLLIIFMVVTPALQQDVQLDLPGIFNPDPHVEGNINPLTVSVAKAGEYFVDQQQYDLDGVIEYLTVQHAYDPNRRLVLRADAKLKYAAIRDFMARRIDAPRASDVIDQEPTQ